MVKSFTEIVQSIKDIIRGRQPNVDISEGTPINDIVINAPAQEIADLYEELDTTQKAQSVNTAGDSGLEIMITNVGDIRKSSRYAKGVETFFSFIPPLSDIKIPAGTIVATTPTNNAIGKQFITTRPAIMYSTLAQMYLNPDNGLYEIDVDIEATGPGVEYIVGSNNITALYSTVSGISGCYNSSPTYGGAGKESLENLRARVAARWRGSALGTSDGLLSEILSNVDVEDAIVVGGHAPEREDFGAIDIYIRGKKVSTYREVFSLFNGIISSRFTKQPVIPDGIVSVISAENGVLLPADYSVVQDINAYGGSTEGFDSILWPLGTGSNNTVITVEYTYNSLIEDLQRIFNKSNKDLQNTSILIKWAAEIPIDITIDIKVFAGYDEATVIANVEEAISLFYNDLSIGEEVQQADAAEVVLSVEGIDDLRLPFNVFSGDGGTITPNAFGNLELPQYGYAVNGTITINSEIVTKPNRSLS